MVFTCTGSVILQDVRSPDVAQHAVQSSRLDVSKQQYDPAILPQFGPFNVLHIAAATHNCSVDEAVAHVKPNSVFSSLNPEI